MAKKTSGRKYTGDAPSMTVEATPRVMSALPPRTRIKSADVEGGEKERTFSTVTGQGAAKKRKIDGIAIRGRTKGTLL